MSTQVVSLSEESRHTYIHDQRQEQQDAPPAAALTVVATRLLHKTEGSVALLIFTPLLELSGGRSSGRRSPRTRTFSSALYTSLPLAILKCQHAVLIQQSLCQPKGKKVKYRTGSSSPRTRLQHWHVRDGKPGTLVREGPNLRIFATLFTALTPSNNLGREYSNSISSYFECLCRPVFARVTIINLLK